MTCGQFLSEQDVLLSYLEAGEMHAMPLAMRAPEKTWSRHGAGWTSNRMEPHLPP